MRLRLLLAAVLVHVTTPAFAADCEALLLKYDDPKALEPRYLADLTTPAGGRLYYFGAEHSTDANHVQFAAIEKAWNDIHPTVAFYEGQERKAAEPDRAAAIAKGEADFVVFLARRDGVPLARLEPDPTEEAAHVREVFPADAVDLFYVLRQTTILRDRKGVAETQLPEAIGGLITKARGMGLLATVDSVDALEHAFDARFEQPENWWQVPADWFQPFVDPNDTSPQSVFRHINQRSSEFRNVSMFRKLSAATTPGARVFAVVGRNHVPMQIDALGCALK